MSIFGLTDNFGFNLINFASQTWHTDEYDNWRKLDSLLTGTASPVPFAADTGAVNAIVADYTPAITSYTSGLILAFRPMLTNTNSIVTINVNGLGLKYIEHQAAGLPIGAIVANGYVKVVYNGIYFELLEPKIIDTTPADGSITPAKLTTGHPTWDGSGNLTETNNITAGGFVKAADVKSSTDQIFFRQADASFVSGTITFSTADPSGGNNGDIWLKYT